MARRRSARWMLVLLWFGSAWPGPAAADDAAARGRAVDAVFARVTGPDSPGCAVSVVRSGETVHARGYGLANLEQPAPITPGSVFEAGSVSKQFTAAAVALLAADGRLSLDDPARKHLPEVPDFGAPLTIRQMLNHTSGLRSFRPLVALQGRPDGRAVHTNREILALVGRQHRLNFAPGEQYLYSNNGYILAALVVERVSGRRFGEFCAERMFRPLAMASTQWRDDFTRIDKGRATAYETGSDGALHANMSFSEIVGNGGLLTTVGDLQAWNRELSAPKVLGSGVVEAMQTPGRLNDGSTTGYALGLEVGAYRGLREIAHSGGTAGYRAYLARYPERDLSVALLCNHGDLNPVGLSRQVVDAFLAAPGESPRPVAATVTSAELEALAGLYHDAQAGAVMRVSVAQGALVVGEMKAVPLGAGRFRIGGVELAFEPGGPRRLLVGGGEGKPRVLVAVPAVSPTPMELAEYAGSYRSDELGVRYSVSVQGGRLLLQRPPDEPWRLQSLFADTFDLGDPVLERYPLRKRFVLAVSWVARFSRDGQGRVVALEISENRARHMRFVRE